MATAKAKAPAKRKATRKKAAPRKATPAASPVATPDYNSPEWAATVHAYATLQEAGLDIPAEIAVPVKTWLAEQRKAEEVAEAEGEIEAAAITKANEEGPKWVRNLLTSPFSLRLTRQDKKQRIELKPRGVRGDMFPLEPGDENDHIIRANLGYIEIIGDGTARKALEGQTHNIQKTNSTLAMITNELGDPITKLVVETEYNQQGVVVGYVDPNEQAKLERGEFGRSRSPLGDLTRQQPEQVLNFVPTGGNPAIVSQGPLTDNAKAAVADKLARIKGRQGRPEDVLGLTVSVEPPRQA